MNAEGARHVAYVAAVLPQEGHDHCLAQRAGGVGPTHARGEHLLGGPID